MDRQTRINLERLRLFRALFVAREDAYASWQGDKPTAVRNSLTDKILAAHLEGEYRVSSYLIKPNGKTPFVVFDVDVRKRSLVRKIVRRLCQRHVAAYVERSKSKGFHIWLFFEKPLRAKTARAFTRIVLRGLENKKVEVFPKQDKVSGDGLGNCISLPLFGQDIDDGRTAFLDKNFDALTNQWSFLRSIRRTPKKLIIRAVRKSESKTPEPSESSGPSNGPIHKGARNTTLTSLAGAMRRQGASKGTILAALREENRKRCRPPLPHKEVAGIASSVSKYTPAKKNESKRSDEIIDVMLGEGATFCHTPQNEGYVTVRRNDHEETFSTRDASLKRYLATRFYEHFKAMPRSQDLTDILNGLEGIALFKSPEQEVFTRVGKHDRSIFLDLCDEDWQVVEITQDKWRVAHDSPVKFRRARGMKALPMPERGGSIADLRPFLNLSSDENFVLVASWLVAALRPSGPYPVLVLLGEAGSAKSTAVRVLRELIDPNTTPLRSEPRETRDLMIAARNSWCVAFDNISHLGWRLSDDLCRLATGGGFSTRQLYTDADEALFDATRPIILNGIDAVVTRGDLIDRSLVMSLPVISELDRRPEAQFWRLYRKVQPRLLGALLDAVSCALQHVASVKLAALPRMADFAQWAVAASTSFGWDEATFIRAHDSNRARANVLSLEASPLVTPLRGLLIARSVWRGTASVLLRRLTQKAPEDDSKLRTWPKNPQVLSGQLRRIAPNLRPTGLDIQLDEKTAGSGSKRMITIKRIATQQKLEETPSPFTKGVQSYEEPTKIRRFPRLSARPTKLRRV